MVWGYVRALKKSQCKFNLKIKINYIKSTPGYLQCASDKPHRPPGEQQGPVETLVDFQNCGSVSNFHFSPVSILEELELLKFFIHEFEDLMTVGQVALLPTFGPQRPKFSPDFIGSERFN